MRIEEEHEDVLQNIEFAVATLYRRNPEMTDYAVLRTYEALVQAYSSEVTGRALKPIEPSGLEVELFRHVRTVCEWRLGRGEMCAAQGDAMKCEPIDTPTLVLCLKRLVKSVQRWTKRHGRQGYLSFMTQFVK